MTDIRVLPLEPGVFSVEITEGDDTTVHRVAVPQGFLDQLGIEAEVDDVARETVGFLLDRLPGVAIPAELSTYDVAGEHDDFTDELIARLGA